MNSIPRAKLERAIKSALIFMVLLIAFSLIYTQSPLYTSNQNQYFLHGLARAGFGELDEDWLANTTEPTPVFSWIVQVSYQFFRTNAVFYLYYAVLMGIYIYSLLRIVLDFDNNSKSRAFYLLCTALLLLIHSAALRFFISRILGINWTYILEDGIADQRLLGPVFQPSVFGILLLVSILLFLKHKPFLSILFSVLAATIHPTYLLTAGSLVLSYMIITFREDRVIWKAALYGLFALILVLPILTYIYTNFTTTPPETLARAQNILVNFRIPHHALVSFWFDSTAGVKILLIISALYLVRNDRIFLILFIPFLVSSALTISQIMLHSNTLALIFPWRTSTLLVPLSSSIILIKLVSVFYRRNPELFLEHKKSIEILSGGLIIILMAIGAIRIKIDFNNKASIPEKEMMDFVSQNLKREENYLIPKKMQDFRLETGAPVFVEFKSIPYNPEDVIEWYRRIKIIEDFYKKIDCDSMKMLLKTEDVNRFIVPNNGSNPACADISTLYQDGDYWIYAPLPAN